MSKQTLLSIWENKYIIYKFIEVYYYDNDELEIQRFDNDYNYPDQTWYANKVIVLDEDNKSLVYDNVYITYYYSKGFVLE